MSKSDFDIICFAEDWYKTSHSSSMQIVGRLARGRRLLWVNPLPVRLPSLKGQSERSAFRRKVLHKLKTHLKLLRRDGPGVWIYSPLYLPLFMSRRGDRINALLLALQVGLVSLLLGLRRPLIWGSATYHPLLAARRLRHRHFIYYFADKTSAFTDLPEARREEVSRLYREYDEAICREADMVYCASLAIYDDLVGRIGASDRIAYLPHGVDFEHFSSAGGDKVELPSELRDLPHPVVGYFGSMTNHNNKSILKGILERHPDWSVVLIGKPVGDYGELAAFPNCYLPGPAAYGELPVWAGVFDIGIMNWIETEWIYSSFPIKAQEYLALGLPVVSVRIRELEENFSEFVRITGDEEEFIRLVEEELAGDSAEKRQLRRERVRACDWSLTAERILRDLGVADG
ncbi:MAG: glycosyltransferase family 1 protein [bacterium]|nr:glycosyltransferase family 1 protein [bacterium]